MLKYHKIVSVLIGVAFFLLMNYFTGNGGNWYSFAGACLLYVGAVTWYNYWYLRQTDKFNLWVLVRPLLFLVSGILLTLIIPNGFLHTAFLVCAVVLIAFFEILLGNYSENIVTIETALTAFGFLAVAAAFREYFPQRLWWSVIGTFVSVLILTRSFFEFIPHSSRIKAVTALGLSLFMAEIFWAMSFLPYHYSAITVVLLSLFYLFVMLTYYSFFKVLDRKKLYFHLLITAICIVGVLIVTPWQPLR
jgi:hypothetical protein